MCVWINKPGHDNTIGCVNDKVGGRIRCCINRYYTRTRDADICLVSGIQGAIVNGAIYDEYAVTDWLISFFRGACDQQAKKRYIYKCLN